MKQLLTFMLVGGVVFVLAASALGGLYWFAPIVPCRVEEVPSGHGFAPVYRSHEDTCAGEVLHTYEYPRRHHVLRSARMLQMGLGGASLFAGFLGGLVAMNVVNKKRRRPAA